MRTSTVRHTSSSRVEKLERIREVLDVDAARADVLGHASQVL
jgi:hypothetical protein